MTPLLYQCVDCKKPVSEAGERYICTGCARRYERQGLVLVAWPSAMHRLAEEEAEHHDHDDSDAVEVHQLSRPRNRYYHEALWQAVRTVPRGRRVLEIGAGSGYDAEQLASDYQLILSDVSPETLARLSARLGITAARYVAADGSHLPFANASFAAVYMVATLHHLPYPGQGLAECARVLEPGGKLAIAIEPNMVYFRPIKYLRRFLCRLTRMNPEEGSHADAEMEGFSYRELELLFTTAQWQDVSIRPAWLFAGWWHYLSEFAYRAFRLKKRLILPERIEWALVRLDERLFRIPGVKHLAWHWNVTATKRG